MARRAPSAREGGLAHIPRPSPQADRMNKMPINVPGGHRNERNATRVAQGWISPSPNPPPMGARGNVSGCAGVCVRLFRRWRGISRDFPGYPSCKWLKSRDVVKYPAFSHHELLRCNSMKGCSGVRALSWSVVGLSATEGEIKLEQALFSPRKNPPCITLYHLVSHKPRYSHLEALTAR